MGACASRFKVSKDSGDAQPPPVTKEAAVVVEEEVKDKDVEVDDIEAKHQSLGQMLIQENEGEEGLVKNDSKASGEVKQEDGENEALKCIEDAEDAEKTEGKPILLIQDKTAAEPAKAVESEGNEESATEKKPEAKKIGEAE